MALGDGTNFTISPNMGLRAFTPGVCGALGVEPAGKSWGELLSSSFSTIDVHNHAPGNGVQVPTAGISINADLSFGGFNLTGLRSARFSALALSSLTAADVGCLAVSGSDLYYVDTAGNQVRLTSGGGVAGTPGSISGLASPAAVTYTVASKLFAFTSSSGFAANLSSGPLSIADATLSGGKSATFKVPAGLAASYNLQLPSALPGAQSFLTLDASGNIATGVAYSGGLTTAHLSASAGILGSQLANGTIGSTQIAAGGVARSNLVAVGAQLSASSGNFTTNGVGAVDVTNMAVTITTTGRPVVIVVAPDGNGATGAYISALNSAGQIWIDRGGAVIDLWGSSFPGPGFVVIDPVAAGTYTYKFRANAGGTGALTVNFCRLVVYEL